MPTTAAKTATQKATATKATKAAPAKKTAAKKAAKPRATKAAPVAPEAAAVAAFVEAYRPWYRGRAGFDKDHVSPEAWRAARVKVCELAGCKEPGPGHRFAYCLIKAELTGLMTAVQRAQYPAFCADRTGAATAVLTHRLTELAD
jgi:pyruvate/2-oxoglutarate dehydrogenase complex dihydrolipoamide acyltransferase (E2) component